MKKSLGPGDFMAPYMAWSEYANNMFGLGISSAQVISHRTRRMAQADFPPNASDSVEFVRMFAEKGNAFAASMWGSAVPALALSTQWYWLGLRQWMSFAQAMTAMSATPFAMNAWQRHHGRMLQASLSHSVAAAPRISHAAARLASASLKPFHSRATANAKRLGKTENSRKTRR